MCSSGGELDGQWSLLRRAGETENLPDEWNITGEAVMTEFLRSSVKEPAGRSIV